MKFYPRKAADTPQFKRLFKFLLIIVSNFKLKNALDGSFASRTWIRKWFSPFVRKYSTLDSSLSVNKLTRYKISLAFPLALSLECTPWSTLVHIHCHNDRSASSPAPLFACSCLTMQSVKNTLLLSKIYVNVVSMLDSTSLSCMCSISTMAPMIIEAVCPLRLLELNY